MAERDECVRVVTHPVNLGRRRAVVSGMAEARGVWTVALDGDLQDPPEAIPALIARANDGFDIVFAGRRGDYESAADSARRGCSSECPLAHRRPARRGPLRARVAPCGQAHRGTGARPGLRGGHGGLVRSAHDFRAGVTRPATVRRIGLFVCWPLAKRRGGYRVGLLGKLAAQPARGEDDGS